jgi:hypothetical protein
MLPVKVLQLGSIIQSAGLDLIQYLGGNYPGQEIVHHDILVMETHQSLNLRKRQIGIRQHPVVKAKKQALELGHNAILIVARIAD